MADISIDFNGTLDHIKLLDKEIKEVQKIQLLLKQYRNQTEAVQNTILIEQIITEFKEIENSIRARKKLLVETVEEMKYQKYKNQQKVNEIESLLRQ